MGPPLCLNWSHEVLLQKYGILLRSTIIPCLAVAFQVPQNSFGIWVLVFDLESFAGSAYFTGTCHPQKRWACSRCLCSTCGKKKRNKLPILFTPASNGVNPVRGLSWRPWLWTSAILSVAGGTCSIEHNSGLCCQRNHPHNSNPKARAEFYH